jgi:hypothetical protein
MKLIGAGIAIFVFAQRLKVVFFDQIKDCNASLLLNIGIAPQDGRLIEFNIYDARIGHSGSVAAALGLGQVFLQCGTKQKHLSTRLSPLDLKIYPNALALNRQSVNDKPMAELVRFDAVEEESQRLPRNV